MDETSQADSALQIGQDSYDDLDDEFDPLAANDLDINQDDMDDDNPLDTVDYPTLRNMPASFNRESVYTPERAGSVREAVFSLIDHNPALRKVLLEIIEMCRHGLASSEVVERVDAIQKDTFSVFAPMTLCRMLERAGALELDMPEVAKEVEDIEQNVEYLEITSIPDPVWRATEEGLVAYDELTQGREFREVVLGHDARYLEVYRAVMEATKDTGLSKKQIETMVDGFDVVQHPRRFGGHFIDILERTGALEWKDRAWHLSDFGRCMLNEMDATMGENNE